MKKKAFFILVIVGLFGVLAILHSVIYQSMNTNNDNTLQEVMCFEDTEGEYYIRGASPNIVFNVEVIGKEKPGYQVIDGMGNILECKVKKLSGRRFKILPPSDGYMEGDVCEIILEEGTKFSDENMNNAKKIKFSIEREDIEHYKYSDKVLVLQGVPEVISNDVIRVNGENIAIGNILLYTGDINNIKAYKVLELDDGVAKVGNPTIDEIYDELNVYGAYNWSFEDIEFNSDLDIEIVEKIKESSFFKNLVYTAYAGEEKYNINNVKIIVNKESKGNDGEISIDFEFKPGEKGLFGDEKLRNHKVEVSFTNKIEMTTYVDIDNVKKWDVSSRVTTTQGWNVNISLINEDSLSGVIKNIRDVDKGLEEKEYQKVVGDIVEKLSKIEKEDKELSYSLGKVDFYIPAIPGLKLTASLDVFLSFEMAVGLDFGQSTVSTCIAGIRYENNVFRPYKCNWNSEEQSTCVIQGKAKIKAGVKLKIALELLSEDIAMIGVAVRTGLYVDAYASVPIIGFNELTDRQLLYIYIEPGVFLSVVAEAKLNLILDTLEYENELYEVKKNFKKLTYGNKKIPIQISVSNKTIMALDEKVYVSPVYYKYYDITEGQIKTELLSYDILTYTLEDGYVLSVSSEGVLDLPDSYLNENQNVTVKYEYEGFTFTDEFNVIVGDGTIAGKVSVYIDELSHEPLPNATVTVYENSTTVHGTPLISKLTDADGCFSFKLSEGTYRLVINRDGFQTITTTQKVKRGELGYTEHILLIDESLSGKADISGNVTCAINGMGIDGIEIKIREGWNAKEGDYLVGFTATTDVYGNYSIKDIPTGYYTVEAQKEGYVTGHTNIFVINDTTRNVFVLSLSPVMLESEVRVVLTWGKEPKDLDLYMFGYEPAGELFKVFYSNREYQYEGVNMITLDVDDKKSYGPETITILSEGNGTYTCVVHNYSGRKESKSQELSMSGAIVRVYDKDGLVEEYNVPSDQIGVYWTIFKIDENREITSVNELGNICPW